jgi:hypothetical protein|tara:strand:+ start:711 stop:950 length:240 start_codon:yes stop_codon:yes gene_type:complete
MDMNVLQKLDKMPINEARIAAVALIDPKKTKKLVLNRLEYDISKAYSSGEVSRIMWQVYMSGSGYGTIGSAWKKHYASA